MQFRTDLAMESRQNGREIPGVSFHERMHGAIEEVNVSIETEEAARALEKAQGQYITLSYQDLAHASREECQALSGALASALQGLLPKEGDLMVVGLGNRHITADALGSKVVEGVLVTRHLREITEASLRGRLRGVCAVSPGVLGITGMETAEMVQGIVEHVHPAAVIAIDALAARESSRICTTVQVTDTGIRPGSGVGNHRMGLTKETLGVPVIAVGVPMVVYASVIARDALSLLMQDMGMEEGEHESAMDMMARRVSEKGLGDMVVTPREVDELVGKMASVIAAGLNMAMQPKLSEEEIRFFSHDG